MRYDLLDELVSTYGEDPVMEALDAFGVLMGDKLSPTSIEIRDRMVAEGIFVKDDDEGRKQIRGNAALMVQGGYLGDATSLMWKMELEKRQRERGEER